MLEYWKNSDELPHGFSGEEDRVQLNENMTYLYNLWNRQAHEAQNSTTSEIHPPPALVATFYNILVRYGTDRDDEDLDEEDYALAKNLAVWCAGAFSFGQYCYKNGLLISNLEQDRCARVNDEDIAKLLES